MISNFPYYVAIFFALITSLTAQLLLLAVKNSNNDEIRKLDKPLFKGILLWLAIQAFLSMLTVYSNDTQSFPPKIILFGILPTIFLILFLFTTSKGRNFIDSLSIKSLTYLHIVRIPVEIVLYLLFLEKMIPELMTFEGRNFDILAGITAPFVAYYCFKSTKIQKTFLLIWNGISLCLLFNIIVNALLSAPSPIQKFAFDQPNIAILYFPYSWLPTFIVPIVLFSHLASLRQLLLYKPNEQL